jgi:hypothetical protein
LSPMADHLLFVSYKGLLAASTLVSEVLNSSCGWIKGWITSFMG